MKKAVIVAVFMIFSASLFIGSENNSACGSVLHVGGIGKGNFSSISDALIVAVSNDTIFIHPGIYNESVVVEKSFLFLKGESKDSTIIDANKIGCPVVLKANYCVLSNVSLTNSTMWFPFAGVQVFGQNNVIRDSVLVGNYYGCTLLKPACLNRFVNVSMVNNKQCGAYLSGSCSNSFLSVFVSNHSFNGFGIYDLSNNNVISDCFFSNNDNCGVNIRDSDGLVLKNNTMINNSIGLHLPPLPYETTLIDNVVSSNTVVDIEQQQTSFSASIIGCVVLVFAAFIFFECFVFRRR